MIAALGCVVLCAIGHLVRDGWPSFKRMLGGAHNITPPALVLNYIIKT